MSSNKQNYLFYIAEDECGVSDYCNSEQEAFSSFKEVFDRNPDRVIGIYKVNGKSMQGQIIWEDMSFIQF